jgi:hypothetical protein
MHCHDLCRGPNALTAHFDFTSGPSGCTDAYEGHATGAFTYDPAFHTPNRARLRVQAALPFERRRLLEVGKEYYAFEVRLHRTKSTGAGACAGCATSACILLNSMTLFQTQRMAHDPVITLPAYRNFVSWQSRIPDCPLSTPVQVSLVSSEVAPDRVRLIWQTHDVDRVAVQRRESGGAWRALASRDPDGQRRVEFEDADVRAGATYDYRLAVQVPAGELYMGETRVVVPLPPERSLALSRVAWLASTRTLSLSMSVPVAGSASLELYDVNGRRIARERFDGLTPGTHERSLDLGRLLRPGMFFAHLSQGGAGVSKRFVVVP